VPRSLHRLGQLPVRIDDEFVGDAGVERFVRLITLMWTILTMGRRSRSIACMSCRLYFSTAVKWCGTFAQPRLRRRLRLPCLAACSRWRRDRRYMQTGIADRVGCSGDLHQIVQHDSRRFDGLAIGFLALSLRSRRSRSRSASATSSPRLSCPSYRIVPRFWKYERNWKYERTSNMTLPSCCHWAGLAQIPSGLDA
jgi:hypothetical protein